MKDYENYAYDGFTLKRLTTLLHLWYRWTLPRANKIIGQIRKAIVNPKYIYHHCRSMLK